MPEKENFKSKATKTKQQQNNKIKSVCGNIGIQSLLCLDSSQWKGSV